MALFFLAAKDTLVRAFKLTNSFNCSIALGTKIIWGYLFDIFLFGVIPDWITIIGAILLIYGNFKNL